MVYQSFSLLTANQGVLAHPELARIARRHGRTVSQVVFRFALDVGMVPLTGTTDAGHMREDLQVFAFRLEPEEVERIERLEEEKKALADDIRDVYAEAKANGFDTKALRQVVRLRKIDVEERKEQEAILETYLQALGMLVEA